MIKRTFLILFGCVALLFTQEVSLFEKGNQAYQNGEYKQAIEFYKQIVDDGFESAALFYNLGNSYFQLDEIGYAILYYEKAKKISPLDKDIQTNLEMANEKILDDIKFPKQLFIFDLYDYLKFMFPLNQMLWISFFSFVVIFISLWLKRWFFSKHTFGLNTLAVFGLIFFLFWGLLSYVRISHYEEKKGVVVVETSEIYLSPDNNEQAFVLHGGTKFSIKREVNGRYEIELIDGKIGWVDINDIEII